MSLDTASDPEKRLTGAHMLVANVALLGGIVTGLLQGLEHAGVEFPASEYFLRSYYHSVSMHGVLNVLVWTTFFIAGFLPFISARAYAMPQYSWQAMKNSPSRSNRAVTREICPGISITLTLAPGMKRPWMTSLLVATNVTVEPTGTRISFGVNAQICPIIRTS